MSDLIFEPITNGKFQNTKDKINKNVSASDTNNDTIDKNEKSNSRIMMDIINNPNEEKHYSKIKKQEYTITIPIIEKENKEKPKENINLLSENNISENFQKRKKDKNDISFLKRIAILIILILILLMAIWINSKNNKLNSFKSNSDKQITSSESQAKEDDNNITSTTNDNFEESFNNMITGNSEKTLPEIIDTDYKTKISGENSDYTISIKISLASNKLIKDDNNNYNFDEKDLSFDITKIESDIDVNNMTNMDDKSKKQLQDKINKEEDQIKSSINEILNSDDGKQAMKKIMNDKLQNM